MNFLKVSMAEDTVTKLETEDPKLTNLKIGDRFKLKDFEPELTVLYVEPTAVGVEYSYTAKARMTLHLVKSPQE